MTEACGGINYFVASSVGYLCAGAVYRQWGHRVAFLVASALMPLAANGLRFPPFCSTITAPLVWSKA